ncbi:MAG: restriction endonuclease subunit S, partial [Paenisporosarcina sp.]|nr:restriction endonuclease subunit S [Paenisporosarcina sp.]
MKVKLQEIATLTQGAYISRVETSENDEESIQLDLLTLKEFNETLGTSYRMTHDKAQTVYVRKDKITKHLLTSDCKLIVHLLTQKAATLPKKYAGRIIPTNFVAV